MAIGLWIKLECRRAGVETSRPIIATFETCASTRFHGIQIAPTNLCCLPPDYVHIAD